MTKSDVTVRQLRLPDAGAIDVERRGRFEREAQAIAVLNHPHIVTIYSTEEADGTAFLTMELVEGHPLSEAIPRSGMPLGRLLPVALAVVEAVAAAHQKGITHQGPQADQHHDRHRRARRPGQSARLRARQACRAGRRYRRCHVAAHRARDRRRSHPRHGRLHVARAGRRQGGGRALKSVSVGVILYEMATGRKPFSGETNISIISSIVKDTPTSVTEINSALPRELGRIVRRALTKDPERRYQTAKDLRNDLEDLKTSLESGELAPESVSVAPMARAAPGRAWRWAALGIAAVSTAAIVGLVRRAAEPVAPASTARRLELTRLTSTGGACRPAIAPDGRYVAYVEGDPDEQSVWVHQIAGNSRVRIVNPAPRTSIESLAITPDGSFVDFVRREGTRAPELWRVPFLGGAARKVVDQVWSAPGWSPDGTQMAFIGGFSNLVVAEADGARPRVIAGRQSPERYLSSPGMKTVNGIATMGNSNGAWFKDTEGNIMALIQTL